MYFHDTFQSPLGRLTLIAHHHHLHAILLPKQKIPAALKSTHDPQHPMLTKTKQQLAEYFNGTRQKFDVELAPQGTTFQQRIWANLKKIPYGKTCSYRDLAASAGAPKAYRAAGTANSRNPLPIVIPCHRVIAADGSLGGYSGGLKIKKQLLNLESAQG